MTNPVIAELTRGGIVESRHRGAFCVRSTHGAIQLSAGGTEAPVFPRSAIKAFQCLPMIEAGAAARYGLTDEEIALCCASHNGEPEHVRVARQILAKCGLTEECFECGAHWPVLHDAEIELARSGGSPLQVHNNCSGKHAGMLAFARHLGVATSGYISPAHPVQQAVAATLSRYCDYDVSQAATGFDGCSVPTWAIPLRNLAYGFARLSDAGNAASQKIIAAVRAHPFMIAGTRNFDTGIMRAVPRLFIKYGAEGVYCGTIPHAGLGFALKCDDGAKRAAEVAIASVLAQLDCWSAEEHAAIQAFAAKPLRNWRKIETGAIHAVTS